MTKKEEIVGYINNEIAIKWHLQEHLAKPIVKTEGLFRHIDKHKTEYLNELSLITTIANISNIISSPDYVYYNIEQSSLEYYAELIENVSVVVGISKKAKLYIKSIYPVNEIKISNRKQKENQTIQQLLINKYTYKGNLKE